MVFNSFAFLIFFPIVLILYRVLPKRARWVMLLAASYFFYMSWQADLIYLILFTTLISYVCALGIEKAKKQGIKRLLAITAAVASLGVLFFFKYFNFLAGSVCSLINLFGADLRFSLDLMLPVGISFYTFQTLSYVIDVYRGKMKAERHFGYYALYVSYFPQLVAGPIERPENLLPQLRADNHPSPYMTSMGLKMMAVGFFKKIAVADQISRVVDLVYSSVSNGGTELFNGFTVLVATALFSVQIYCDFSGYTDIAIGCAKIMGINLMQNFKDPYSATNIRDFWRRWHISLTSWFTDYVYIPLGGSRCSRAKHYANIFIVFLLSGIWHGAAWTYVIWGVMHGVYQIIGHITSRLRARLWDKLKISQTSATAVLFKRVVTFLLVLIAWVAFRANSTSDMISLYKTLFSGWSGLQIGASLSALSLDWVKIISIVLMIYIVKQLDLHIALRNSPSGEYKGTFASGFVYIVLCWAVAVAWLLLLSSGGASSFIYFQF